MAGAFDFLDTLTSNLGDVAGRAVDAVGAVASAKIAAEQARATQPDITPVAATSPLQTATATLGFNPLWLIGGVVTVGALVLLMRRT